VILLIKVVNLVIGGLSTTTFAIW